MKTLKNLIQIVALFAMMSSFFACQEEIDPPAPPTTLELSIETGEVHNACMAYVRDYLVAELAKVDPSTMTKEKLRDMTKDGCILFINENDFFSDDRAKLLDLFEGIWEDYGRATAGAGTALTPIEIYLENSTVLTDNQHSYAIDALLIINNSTVPTGCKMEMDSLFNLTLARLGEEQGMPILMGCGVGSATFEYWTNHLDDWKEIGDLLGGNGRPFPGTTRNDVSKADVGGAVGGAAASVLSGCAEVTLGVCAAGGAAVGGIATSLGKIAENVWDHYF